MNHVCYTLRFKKKNKIVYYIGSSSEFEKRLNRHLRDLKENKHHNKNLQRFYNDGYVYDENPSIYYFGLKQEAYDKEQELINHNVGDPALMNIGIGYNNLSNNPDKENIVGRISASIRTTMDNMTDDERKSKWGQSGVCNPMYGRKHSEDVKNLISEKIRNYYKLNVSKNKGIKKSIEHRKLLSELASQRTGDKNPFYGKTHSEETKKKLSIARLGNIPSNAKRVSIENVEYISLTDAGRKLNLSPSVVLWRIKSNNKKFIEWNWL